MCNGLEDVSQIFSNDESVSGANNDINTENHESNYDKRLLRDQIRFPNQLYSILENVKHASTISWVFDGKAFSVYEPQKLEKEVMPLYFKTSKLKSFQKQLNTYGFERTKIGGGLNIYYHQHFVQNNSELLLLMHRVNTWPKKSFKRA